MSVFKARTSAECSVVIRSVNGKEYQLGVGTQYPFVTSVSVVQAMNLTESISVELDMPFFVGKELFNSDMFTNGNYIDVVMGYGDDRTKKFSAWINEGASGLTIDMNGVSGSLSGAGVSSQASNIHVFKRNTGEANNAFVTRIGATAQISVSFPNGGDIASFNRQRAFELNGAYGVKIALEEICNDLGFAYVYKSEPPQSTFEIRSSSKPGKPASQVKPYLFVMRGVPFGEASLRDKYNVYPLISFSPEETGPLFGRQSGSNPNVSGVAVAEVGADGSVMTATASLSESTADRGRQPTGGDVAQGGRAQSIAPEATLEAQRARALAINENAAVEYSASLTTIGIPTIEVDEQVIVLGLGPVLDGVFRVKGFTHTWNGANIETQMTLYARNSELLSNDQDLKRLSGG